MNLICYKIAAALIIFLISVVTVIYPLKTKGKIEHAETFELGEALASGIFLGVAFFHMLLSGFLNYFMAPVVFLLIRFIAYIFML